MSQRPRRNVKAPQRFQFSPDHKVNDDQEDSDYESDSNELFDCESDSESHNTESLDEDFVPGNDDDDDDDEIEIESSSYDESDDEPESEELDDDDDDDDDDEDDEEFDDEDEDDE